MISKCVDFLVVICIVKELIGYDFIKAKLFN